MQDMRKSHRRKILNLSLQDDESGIALIYVTVALPVIIGFALLTVEPGRVLSQTSFVARIADLLSPVGAVNLDGTSKAIVCAESAIKHIETCIEAASSHSVDKIKRDFALHFPDDSTAISRAFASTVTGEDLGTSGSS